VIDLSGLDALRALNRLNLAYFLPCHAGSLNIFDLPRKLPGLDSVRPYFPRFQSGSNPALLYQFTPTLPDGEKSVGEQWLRIFNGRREIAGSSLLNIFINF
jgi:hypothetical protein